MTVLHNGFETRNAEKKRLGQYFTGLPLATLTAAAAGIDPYARIIDPMVGSGDMLEACLLLGAEAGSLFGIDIDARAVDLAHHRIPGALLEVGSAFSHDFGTDPFDLVITNPPYVRYQSTSAAAGADFAIPSAEEVRRTLCTHIRRLPYLAQPERASLLRLAQSYSGLADLAVPSWILCASLVREGGIVAILVPQAWLNRDYAVTVRELLGRHFSVETILEDTDASWFTEAQIRTSIVIARRKAVDPSAPAFPSNSSYIRVRVTSKARVGENLVGSFGSEPAFIRHLGSSTADGEAFSEVASGIEAQTVCPRTLTDGGRSVPEWLAHLFSEDTNFPPLVTLADLGWSVGQGLRTGANEFFYAESNGDEGDVILIPRLAARPVSLPAETVLPAVRKQSDVHDGFAIRAETLSGRLVSLDGWATKEDAFERARTGLAPMNVLGSAASNAIHQASQRMIGKLPLPLLSAVKTNVRQIVTAAGPVKSRYWYQLPTLQSRHRPDLAIPRVCGGRPRTRLNVGRDAVIDANFSSLWATSSAQIRPKALLALLNSDYVVLTLEHQAHVLGGGALKIEATHLRKILLPRLNDTQLDQLEVLGAELVDDVRPSSLILTRVNELVSDALAGDGDSAVVAGKIAEQASQALTRRQPSRR